MEVVIRPLTAKLFHFIGLKWPMTQMVDRHIGQSQMANGGLLGPVMSPGLKSPPWSTHILRIT